MSFQNNMKMKIDVTEKSNEISLLAIKNIKIISSALSVKE